MFGNIKIPAVVGDPLGFVFDRLLVEKSEFIGCICRTENEAAFLDFLAAVKAKFPKARHYPYASFTSSSSRSSDDKEPTGTAGKPICEAILRENLSSVSIVVPRYFGGKKLGASGLSRAYSNAASLALKKQKISPGFSFVFNAFEIKISCEYKDFLILSKIIEKNHGFIKNSFFLEKTEILFIIPEFNKLSFEKDCACFSFKIDYLSAVKAEKTFVEGDLVLD